MKQLSFNKSKHFRFNFWDSDSIDFGILSELRGVHIVLSSDFVINGINLSNTNFTENLVELFIWNDEEETIFPEAIVENDDTGFISPPNEIKINFIYKEKNKDEN